MRFFKIIQAGGFPGTGTLHEWLLLSSAFSCCLLFARIMVTGTFTFIFLPWNLFLAFIPYWIARWIISSAPIIKDRVKLAIALLIWLLFIPNSFYIITDLFHLDRFPSAPRWFDLLLIFSFAWNGIICGVISLRKVELVIRKLKGKNFSILMVFAVMFLSALGIYIGRFLRFKSWDIITDPVSLLGEIADMVLHPFANSYAWGMTLCYALFMNLIYFTIKKMSDSFIPAK